MSDFDLVCSLLEEIERLEATVDRLEAELKDTVPMEYHDALVWGFQRMILELEDDND